MKTIINSHNHKIAKIITKERTCNCVDKAQCLLSQNSPINNIIYRAVLMSTNPPYKEEIYFGTAKINKKLQYSNRQRSFNFLKCKTDIELSNKVWRMGKSGQTPFITRKIVRECSPYNPNSKKCYLRLNEKLEIATYQRN